ncbi:MAG: hypothetical protein ACYDAJ_03550 [Nitrosotalea sp.]
MGLIAFTKPNFILTTLVMANIQIGIFWGFRILRKNRQKRMDRPR